MSNAFICHIRKLYNEKTYITFIIPGKYKNDLFLQNGTCWAVKESDKRFIFTGAPLAQKIKIHKTIGRQVFTCIALIGYYHMNCSLGA